jgi:hypothetical protein
MPCSPNYPKEAPLGCITSLVVLLRSREIGNSIKDVCAAIYAIIGYALYVTVGEPVVIGHSNHDLLDVEQFSDQEAGVATAAPALDPEVRSKLLDLKHVAQDYIATDEARQLKAVGSLGFDLASFVRGLLALLIKVLTDVLNKS